MATFLVINNNDSGSGSLRQAILNAEESSNPGKDVIEFASWMSGQTIQLQSTLQIQSGKLSMNFDLDGDGTGDVILSGDNETQGIYTDATDIGLLIQVGASSNVSITSLNAVGGGSNAPDGYQAIAGIQNYGILNLADSYMGYIYAYGGSSTGGTGGRGVAGIHNSGTLSVSDTLLMKVGAVGGGGGSYGTGPSSAGYSGGDAIVGILNTPAGTTMLERLGIKNAHLRGGDGADGSLQNGAGGDTFLGLTNQGGTVSGDLAIETNFNIPGDAGAGSGPASPFGTAFVNYGSVGLQNKSNSAIGTQIADTPSIGYSDLFFGFGGNDRLIADSGLGYLYGGGGNDYVKVADPAARAFGGSGSDVIAISSMGSSTIANGGSGNDVLDVSGDSQDFELNMTTGVAKRINPVNTSSYSTFAARNFENVIGTNNVDKIKGTNGANTIAGNDGDDILKGLGGKDRILGGKGDDNIRGGNDNDILRGGNNTDTIKGDNGNDIVHGGSGADFLFGGKNNDILRGGNGNDELQGDAGNDVLRGGDNKDTFIFGKGFDKDIVRDFTDDTDQIALNDNLWKGTLSKNQILNQFANLKSNGDVVFNFGNGDKLIVKDVGNVHDLKNDLVII